MIKLVVLDMAGTTVDEHGDVYKALAGSVTATGASITPENLQRWMGADKPEAIAALLELGGVAPTPGAGCPAVRLLPRVAGQVLRPDPAGGLAGRRGSPADAKVPRHQDRFDHRVLPRCGRPILATLGWGIGDGELLDAVVTNDEVAAGRPAPYMIHRVMEATGGVHDVRAVVAGGDTVVDLLAGYNAGARPLGVLTGALNREQLETHPHD